MKLQPHGPMRLLQPVMRRKIGQFLADLPGHIQGGLDSADSGSQGLTKSRDLRSSHRGDAAR